MFPIKVHRALDGGKWLAQRPGRFIPEVVSGACQDVLEKINILPPPHEGSYFLNSYKGLYKVFEYNLESCHN